MEKGHFYFLKDEFFELFSDCNLMQNKYDVDGGEHNRPYFYSFRDSNTSLVWIIPISSQIDKFREIYDAKIRKYDKCDTIVFGDVLGFERAFLIQNMCPIVEEYIINEYLDVNGQPVRVETELEAKIIKKAKKVLALNKKGIKLIFSNISKIENILLNR